MSVLFLRRRQPRELVYNWAPCDNGCVETMGRGRAVGKWEAYLMGRHYAWLDGRRDARAFEEAA